MSGIYIKGMEMPTKCEECEWSTTDRRGFFGCRLTGNIVIRKREQDRPDWCPLVPVPPHGRLIDADALIGKLHDECLFDYDARSVVYADIQDAPTIIPADLPVMEYPQVPGITPTVISDKEGEG